MSFSQQQQIVCNVCNTVTSFDMLSNINIDTLSKMDLDSILDGKYHSFVCSSCNAEMNIDYACTAQSALQRLTIAYAGQSSVEMGFHNRAVQNRAEFIEKLTIAMAGLDDRVVEACKLAIDIVLPDGLEMPEEGITLLFALGENNEKLLLCLLDDIELTSVFPMDLYAALAEEYSDELYEYERDLTEQVFVDSQWVQTFFENVETRLLRPPDAESDSMRG